MYTYNDLVDATNELIKKLPPEISGVVGVSRKGMIPATIIATRLHLRLGVDELFWLGYGKRTPLNPDGCILVVDDGIGSGEALQKAVYKVKKLYPKKRFITAASFIINSSNPGVDYWGAVINPVFPQESEFPNTESAVNWMMDLDGVICVDPPQPEIDDEKVWTDNFANAVPMYLPRYKPVVICTSRMEKYRGVTEEWLSKWQCKYTSLIMHPAKNVMERGNHQNIAKWKSDMYRGLDKTLFVESNPYEAALISVGSGKPVYCTTSKQLLTATGRCVSEHSDTPGWKGIEGWFDESGPYYGAGVYREVVDRFPNTSKFVEVGCWKGRSIVFLDELLKKAGKRMDVSVVDTFAGSTADTSGKMALMEGGSVKKQFLDNLKRCGVEHVHVYEGDSVEMSKKFEDGSLDVVSIDANHTFPGLMRDLEAWFPKVKVGGVILGHDYDQRTDPGVPQAVNAFFIKAGYSVEIKDTRNWWVEKTAKPTVVQTPRIFLGMPYSGPVDMRVAQAFWGANCKYAEVVHFANPCTALCRNFNIILATALSMCERGEITHLAMLHDDNLPAQGFLNVLWEEMVRTEADLISAVVAIKDDRGLTSTGIDDPMNTWEAGKRFTSKEIMELPETFSKEDTGFPDRTLLVNTGCWLADIRKPFFRSTNNVNELVAYFTMKDRVVNHNGTYKVEFESEDWFYSRRLDELGAKVVATRKPLITHLGDIGWPNDRVWGKWSEDQCGNIIKLRRMAEAYDSQKNVISPVVHSNALP